MSNSKKHHCVLIVLLMITCMCDGEPLTRNINSDHDPGIAVIKNSHPMLASLFTEANNVSDRTSNSGFGSSMPETANKQQIANLANVTNGQESAIGDLPDILCEACRSQHTKECINKLCLNTALQRTSSPSEVVPLAIPMGGFEQHLIGSGSPVRLDTSVLLNDSTKMSTQSPDSVSGTNKANALDGKPTSNQPDTASLDRKVHESNSHMEVIVAQASQSEAAAKVMQMMGGPHDVPVVNSPSIDVNDTHINIPRAHDIFTTQTETEDSVVVSHPVDQTLELQVLNLLSGQQGFNETDGAHSAAILDQNVTTSTASPTIPPRRNAELQNFGKNFLSGLKSSLRSKS